ncbi:hypothetical protein ACIHFD_33970 [Nonomuraea sp. NPDC051941]|uniref:hypothetical protein n=1 Tax=Nonomuraea sp. NPDC051941 TaxID=3364373 RepID=UPI0037CCB0FA
MADGSDGTGGRWRIARCTPPGRIVSAVDPEARHAAVASDLLDHERGPLQILADAAYAAELRATLTDAGHRLLSKPPALKPAVLGCTTAKTSRVATVRPHPSRRPPAPPPRRRP